LNLIEAELSAAGIYMYVRGKRGGGEMESYQFPKQDKPRCYWEKENMIKRRADDRKQAELTLQPHTCIYEAH
jgi:hypothetical protein